MEGNSKILAMVAAGSPSKKQNVSAAISLIGGGWLAERNPNWKLLKWVQDRKQGKEVNDRPAMVMWRCAKKLASIWKELAYPSAH